MTSLELQPCDDCPRPASGHIAADLLGETVRRTLYTLRSWRQRIRARNELARLDERMLKDIGLNPADRDLLVNKPFWRE